MSTTVWTILTIALALLVVSGWGFVWWIWRDWDIDWRWWYWECKDILKSWEESLKWTRGCCEQYLKINDENKSIRRTAALLRARIFYQRQLRSDNPVDELELNGDLSLRFSAVVVRTHSSMLRNSWRSDRATGNWGKYLSREKAIRLALSAEKEATSCHE